MANVIDYQSGERIDPVTGKPIKRVTTGAVAGDFSDMFAPVAVGGEQYYAPGFGSNLLEDFEFYNQTPPATPPAPTPQAPAVAGPILNKGGGGDARNDDKTSAGAVNSFGDWVDSIMAGYGAVGVGGPLGAVANQVTGNVDYGDDFGNANQEDPEGWADAVDQATGSMPPNSTSAQISAKAAQIYAEAHPGWGGGPGTVSGDVDGLGGVSAGAHGGYGTTDQEAAEGIAEGIGDPTGIGADALGAITTASAPKPAAPTTPRTTGGHGFGSAGSSPSSTHGFGSGTTPGSGADPSKGSSGGGYGSGSQQGKPDTAGATAGGEKANPGNTHFQMGGYVQNMPTSVTQRKEQQQPQQAKPAAAPAQPAQRSAKPAAFTGLQDSTAKRFTQPSSKGYAAGGFVPKAGYDAGGFVPKQGFQDGGAVPAEPAAGGDMQARFNPQPHQIADDGVTDNQPIQADEGEFVINRESAEILGPEILNGLNNPETALILSDLVEDVLALQGGSAGMAPTGPAGSAAPPTPSAGPAMPPQPAPAAPSANPAQDAMPQQRTPATQPSGYRKGGYVTAMRGSLSKVRC